MRNLILPGYSIENKDWAENIQKQLKPAFDFEVIYWKHWQDPDVTGTLVEREVDGLIADIGEGPINIIAKSIGTLIAMRLSEKVTVEKLILCGIPLNDMDEDDEKSYEILKNFNPEKVLVIQNDADPHGNYLEAEKFVHMISPNIRVILKELNTHEYYYQEDFKNFLR